MATGVYAFKVYDEKIDELKKEVEIWKEREPGNVLEFTITDTVYIPEDCGPNAGREFAVGIYKGDEVLYRRICVIVGISIN